MDNNDSEKYKNRSDKSNKEHSERRSEIIESPGMKLDGCIFEQIKDKDGKIKYAVYREGRVVVEDPVIEVSGKKYRVINKCNWYLPGTPLEYDSNESSYNEIREFHNEHLDFFDDRCLDILTCFTLATWRQEDFNTVPYLFFHGPLNSGKTRALECLQRLCFRAILAANMTTAVLFRAIDSWKPTLLLDETEIYRQQSMTEIRSLLNSGYRRGQYAWRVANVDNGQLKLQSFDVFGFKALAGTRGFTSTLESRCIEIHMEKNIKQLPVFINDERATQIRTKLLTYRFQNNGILYSPKDLAEIKNARVAEIFHPILSVAPTRIIRDLLKEYATELTTTREESEKASADAQVLRALFDSYSKKVAEKISIKDITETINEGVEVNQKWDPRTVGRILKRQGFTQTRMPDPKGSRGIFWDPKRASRLAKRYRLEDHLSTTKLDHYCPIPSKKTSEMSETSEPHLKFPIRSDISDVSDVNQKVGISKSICRSCWQDKQYGILEANGSLRRISEVSNEVCQDCGKNKAEIGIMFLAEDK